MLGQRHLNNRAMVRKVSHLPKISVTIPSYNKADYIFQTLESIINQDYPNLEVIIQDGGSTDKSVGIIKKFAGQYPGIIQWTSGKDGGQVEAINAGLKKSTGEILTYINADDVLSKDALKMVGQVYLQDPEVLWITGYGNIIDGQGKVTSSFVTKYKNILLDINNYQMLLAVNSITQPATFITREAYQKYGPFTGTKRYVMEYELWLKLGRVKMPKVIKKNLASFRLTMDNISATSFKELLSLDYQIAKAHSKNFIILAFHLLNNWGRIGLIALLKNNE